MPIILTGPSGSAGYLHALDNFIVRTLGPEARDAYTLIVGDHEAVANAARAGVDRTLTWRDRTNDALYFNWSMHLDPGWQHPFKATHASMQALELSHRPSPEVRASSLRRLFTGLVSANVREEGIAALEAQGPFRISAEPEMRAALDDILSLMAREGRMRVTGGAVPGLHVFAD
jgi:hypothetical protein